MGGGGTTLPEPAATVEVVLKTPTVYHDSTVMEVAYQLRDAAGRSQVLRTGLTVSLTGQRRVGFVHRVWVRQCDHGHWRAHGL